MKVSFKLKTLVAGAMLLVGGAASANMNIDTTNGDIYLNLWDQTTNNSFLFDTGLNQNNFDGTNTVYSTNLSSDANYAAFLAAVVAGDNVTYNLVSQGLNGAFTTGITKPSNVANSQLTQALNDGSSVAGFANQVSSTTTTSAYATNASNPNAVWFQASPSWNSNLKVNANAAVGTALHFYSLTYVVGSDPQDLATKAIIAAFANNWLLDSSGNLTYGAVPIPAPFGLLLGGLALMGVISRRKPADKQDLDAAAA